MLFDNERAAQLSQLLNKTISPRMVRYWCSKLDVTRKLVRQDFVERYTPKNLDFKSNFLKFMNPKSKNVSFLECMSTDESGFYLNSFRKYGYSKVRHVRGLVKKSKTLAGGSYTNEQSRVNIRVPKQKMGKLNLILTISLNPACPVVGYSIEKAYWTKAMFIRYVNNREIHESQNYDLIDCASIHMMSQNDLKRDIMTVDDAFSNTGVTPIHIPTGYPEFNPIEQSFNYLKQYVSRARLHRNLYRGWKEQELKDVIIEGITTITHNMVKSWYRGSFCYMFPGSEIPEFLLKK